MSISHDQVWCPVGATMLRCPMLSPGFCWEEWFLTILLTCCRPFSSSFTLTRVSTPATPNLAARADDLQLPSFGATRCSQQVPLLLPPGAAPLNHVPCSGFCPHCPGNRCPGCSCRSQPRWERPEQGCSLSAWGWVVTGGLSFPMLTWTPLLHGVAGLRTWNTFTIN